MTKFILVGGYTYRGERGGQAFAREFLGGIQGTPKVLLCYFERPESQWPDKFLDDKEFFSHFGSPVTLKVAETQNFIEQLRWADALYIVGGSEEKLLGALLKHSGWEQELQNKVMAGSSAGADILSTYYYDLDNLQLAEGLGILPIKLLVHYRSDYNAPNIDWDKAEAELKAYKEDLPLVALREGEFKVFTQ